MGADSEESITVCIRVRPLNDREKKDKGGNVLLCIPDRNVISITHPKTNQPLPGAMNAFQYDNIFAEDQSTMDIYQKVASRIVQSTLNGINGTIFAYGQTSSGKTHTMQGTPSNPGILPLAVAEIFQYIEESVDRDFLLRVSYVEIYNEVIQDLLGNEQPSSNNLKVREDPKKGIYVECTEEIITEYDQILDLLKAGEKRRTVGSTAMNEQSSRSHSIFRIVIESKKKSNENEAVDNGEAFLVASLNLVDLAGSESVRHTMAEGQRQREAGNINRSLLTLSRVITSLGQGQIQNAPFRDSKLTRLLQTSLAGNTRTVIICCATPSEHHLEETRSTLQFAQRAKHIRTSVAVNEVLDDRAQLRRMKNELESMRKLMEESQVCALRAENEALGQEKELQQRKISRLKSLILHGSNTGTSNGSEADDDDDDGVLADLNPNANKLRRRSGQSKRHRETWCPGELADSLRKFQMESLDDNNNTKSSSVATPNPQPKKRQSFPEKSNNVSEQLFKDEELKQLQQELLESKQALDEAKERAACADSEGVQFDTNVVVAALRCQVENLLMRNEDFTTSNNSDQFTQTAVPETMEEGVQVSSAEEEDTSKMLEELKVELSLANEKVNDYKLLLSDVEDSTVREQELEEMLEHLDRTRSELQMENESLKQGQKSEIDNILDDMKTLKSDDGDLKSEMTALKALLVAAIESASAIDNSSSFSEEKETLLTKIIELENDIVKLDTNELSLKEALRKAEEAASTSSDDLESNKTVHDEEVRALKLELEVMAKAITEKDFILQQDDVNTQHLKESIDELTEKLALKESQVESGDESLERMTIQLIELEEQNDDLKQQLSENDGSTSKQNERIQSLEVDLDSLTEKLECAKEELLQSQVSREEEEQKLNEQLEGEKSLNETLKTQVAELQISAHGKEASLERVVELSLKVDELNQVVNLKQQALEEAEANTTSVMSELQEFKNSSSLLQEQINAKELNQETFMQKAQADVEAKAMEVTELQQQLVSLNEQLQVASADAQRLQEVESDKEALQQDLLVTNEKMLELSNDLSVLRSSNDTTKSTEQQKELTEVQDELLLVKTQLEELEAEKSVLQELHKASTESLSNVETEVLRLREFETKSMELSQLLAQKETDGEEEVEQLKSSLMEVKKEYQELMSVNESLVSDLNNARDEFKIASANFSQEKRSLNDETNALKEKLESEITSRKASEDAMVKDLLSKNESYKSEVLTLKEENMLLLQDSADATKLQREIDELKTLTSSSSVDTEKLTLELQGVGEQVKHLENEKRCLEDAIRDQDREHAKEMESLRTQVHLGDSSNEEVTKLLKKQAELEELVVKKDERIKHLDSVKMTTQMFQMFQKTKEERNEFSKKVKVLEARLSANNTSSMVENNGEMNREALERVAALEKAVQSEQDTRRMLESQMEQEIIESNELKSKIESLESKAEAIESEHLELEEQLEQAKASLSVKDGEIDNLKAKLQHVSAKHTVVPSNTDNKVQCLMDENLKLLRELDQLKKSATDKENFGDENRAKSSSSSSLYQDIMTKGSPMKRQSLTNKTSLSSQMLAQENEEKDSECSQQ